MAIKKKATKKRKQAPRTLGDALLLDARDVISDDDIANFATYTMTSSLPKSEAKRKATTKAVMRFAILGWQYFCMTKVR